MPTIYRLHIRPTGGLANKRATFDHCVAKGVLGLGWALPSPGNRPIGWSQYVTEATKLYGSARELSRVKYLHDRVAIDDLIWTRDLDGRYYLAQALASWCYDDSQDAWNADVVNIIPCDIRLIGLADSVPGKVVSCFRPTRAIQQIADDTISSFSQLKWNEVSGSPKYAPANSRLDLFALIGDQATEDLVLLYLQLDGWLVMASTRRGDTLAYELVLVHRETCERAVVQVKSGDDPLDPSGWAGRSERVFLFQAHGRYGSASAPGVECIQPQAILDLVSARPQLMPSAVASWHSFARSIDASVRLPYNVRCT